MRSRYVIPIFAALLLTAPALAQTTPVKVTSGWALNGMVEPDTSWDTSGGFMWLGPDTNVTGRSVYFNGFQTSTAGTGSGNYNLATLRTANSEYPQTRMWAALGVWKDCNGDGYIGLADHGLLEYPVQLLDAAGSDRCKPSVPPTKCQAGGPPNVPALVCWIEYGWVPQHNDGKWVHEFIAISWDDTEDLGQMPASTKNDAYPYDFNDTSSRVWADWNRPTDGPSPQCFVWPQQPGTWQSTGGVIAWGDCQTNFRVVQTQSNVANQSAATRPYALNQNGGTYSGNEYPQRSSSPLNQKNPWGDPSAPAAFTAWDCSNPIVQEMTVAGRQVAVGDRWIGVPRPKAPNTSPTPGWSIAGQVNETDNAFADCKRHDKATQERGSLGDTMYCFGDGTLVASQPQTTLCESKSPNTVGPRTKPDYQMTPPTRTVPYGLVDPRVAILTKDYGQPASLGSTSTSLFWSDNSTTTFSRNPFFKKEDLQPRDKQWMTFYAYVNPHSGYGWTLPGGAAKVGSYGNEFAGQCGNGYECDASLWWPGDSMPRSSFLGRDPASCFPAPAPGNDCNGANDKYQPGHPQEGETLSKEDNLKRPRAPYGVKVGQAYNLRDVDCWDMGATVPVKQGSIDHPRVAPFALLANGGSPCS